MALMTALAPQVGLSALAAPKQINRRPALVRKVDETDFDTLRDAIPSSPSKKAKVTFDNEVLVRVVEDWEKAPEVVREEVRRALQRHAEGDSAAYEGVKEIYITEQGEEDAPSVSTLRNYTAALISNVSALNRSCSSLVYAVLQSEWITKDENYISTFLRFLGNLVSAQGVFLGDALRMLVEKLTSTAVYTTQSLDQVTVTRSQIHRRAHAALNYLLRLMPSASSILSTILTAHFPHSSDSKRAHVIYVHNLIKLIEYAPELQSDILALITERLVKIDVQVQVDLEDLAEDISEGVVQSIPNLQTNLSDFDDEDDQSDEESEDEDEDIDPDAQRAKDITGSVEKLDAVLDILFSYYNPLFSTSGAAVRDSTLNLLLDQFTMIILPTYRSRHTQFLLFHFAQTSPDLVDLFAGVCMGVAFDKGRPALVRQSATAYLASFVSRGNHVPSQVVRDVFDYIGRELHKLRAAYETTCRGPNLQRYSNYYSLVQALLYIFCFRWRDLEAHADEPADDEDLPMVDEQTHMWIPGVKETLTQNLFCKLNPLKVCSPAIVNEFAKIANHLNVIYVYHLLETNKRLRLSQFNGSVSDRTGFEAPERETALSGRKDESWQQLDEYFPFDPYHLPRSKRWIEGDYRVWKGIPGLGDDGAVSESEEDDEESEMEEGTGTDEEGSD